MNFAEVEEAAQHRLKRAKQPGTPPANPTGRQPSFFRHLGKKRLLITPGAIGPEVEAIAAAYREKIKEVAETYRLDPENRYHEIQKIREEYVGEVERLKNGVLTSWLKIVADDREAHKAAQAEKAKRNDLQILQAIEQAKADLEFYSEGEIVGKIRAMAATDEWNENVLRVYATKSKTARSVVERMLADQPQNVGMVARDGREEVEAIVSCSRGYMPYRQDGLKLWASIDSMELLNDPVEPYQEPTPEEKRARLSRDREAMQQTLAKHREVRRKQDMAAALRGVQNTQRELAAKLEEVERLREDLQKQLNAQGGKK